MCEHTGEDTVSNNNTTTNNNNNNHHQQQEREDTLPSSSASSVVSSFSGNSNSKKRSTPTKRYTHNPYAFAPSASTATNMCGNAKNNALVETKPDQQQHRKFPTSNSLKKSPAEVELQRGLDSMLITPDAATNFHENNSTLHRSLIGNVSFVPYPTEAVEFNYEYYEAHSPSQMTRVFIGQLPYRVTEMQLQWIFFVFGHGTRIHDPERITKKAKTIGNARVPTGCIHCHIREDKVKAVLECMHKRLLIDDSGIWYARSEKEQDLLEAYINTLKKHPELRFPDRPYDTMVVQEAVSSYQSSQPRWVSNAPEAEKFAETTPSRKAQILYLQQQKMIKMQNQQQRRPSFPAAINAVNAPGVINSSPAAVSSSSAASTPVTTTSTALAHSNTSLNNVSYNSSTSSHPNSEGNNNDYYYHPHANNNNNNNNNNNANTTTVRPYSSASFAHNAQTASNNNNYYYHQQPQQPLMMMNNSNNSSRYFYNNNNNNNTYQS